MKKKILSAWLMLIATFFVSFAAYADTQTIAPNGYSGNNIYLPDQRVQVNNATSFPYNTIVDIQDIFPNNPGEVWRGTGTLIAPGVVLTAGHVIYDKSEGGYANSVTVYQAYANGNYNPSTAVTAKALLAHPDWVAKNNSSPSIYVLGSTDLALIFLNQNIGLQTGWMGMSSSLSVGQPITLAGFPGDYRDQMWKMSGSASSISNSLISYSNISTYPGQSGSPLISTSNTIVGVNVAQAVYGENSSKVPSDQATTYPNWGIQLTTANIAWIQNNVPELKTTALYRLYNPGNSDHLYTKNLAEMRSLATSGWSYEGVNSQQPASGNPVYRLYNRVSGEHFLTMASGERSALLQSRDWSDEGIAFYSDSGQHTPEYRLFNPAAPANKASHFWTSSLNERNTLVSWGWRAEGIGWYGL